MACAVYQLVYQKTHMVVGGADRQISSLMAKEASISMSQVAVVAIHRSQGLMLGTMSLEFPMYLFKILMGRLRNLVCPLLWVVTVEVAKPSSYAEMTENISKALAMALQRP